MIDYITMTVALFLSGNIGQLIDVLLNFGKNSEDIRKADGTHFDEGTNVIELFLFYLKSRQISLFTTTGLLLLVSFFGNIEIIKSIFPTLEGRAILFVFLGYGGQQAIRDFMTATSRRVLNKISQMGE